MICYELRLSQTNLVVPSQPARFLAREFMLCYRTFVLLYILAISIHELTDVV